MEARTYLASDRQACLEIYDASAATLEATHPRKSFEAFLLNPPSSFFVLEHETKLLGCGGFEHAEGSAQAQLIWGLIHADWRRQGLGRYLLMFRLREITRRNAVQLVRLEVPAPLAAFYTQQGFHAVARLENAYAPGMDKIELTKKLTVCS